MIGAGLDRGPEEEAPLVNERVTTLERWAIQSARPFFGDRLGIAVRSAGGDETSEEVEELLVALSGFAANMAVSEAVWQRWITPPTASGPSRRADWIASRTALHAVASALAVDGSRVSLSLSHSAGIAIAVGLTTPVGTRIGVDIEPASRQIEASVLHRVSNPCDHLVTAQPLVRWCAREAAFKAFAEVRGLREVWLREVDERVFNSGTTQTVAGTVRAFCSTEWTLCLAVVNGATI